MSSSGGTPPLRVASRVRLADQVVTILLDAVLDGRWSAGATLPPERELAVELDVNRTSLRQAIARLEQMGVVEARQGRGTVVRDVSTATDPALMAHLVARDRRAMLVELFEVREGIARQVGRLAANRASIRDRQALQDAYDQVVTADTPSERQARELEFFDVLVAGTGNRPLVAMQHWVDAAYGDAAERFTHAFDDADAITTGLGSIIEAIEAGDPDTAAAATAAYAAASADRMLAAGTRRSTPRPKRTGARR